MLMQKLDPDPASRPALIFNAAIARDCMDRPQPHCDVWRKRRQFGRVSACIVHIAPDQR